MNSDDENQIVQLNRQFALKYCQQLLWVIIVRSIITLTFITILIAKYGDITDQITEIERKHKDDQNKLDKKTLEDRLN